MIDWFAAADKLSGNTTKRTPTLTPELAPYWERYQRLEMQPLRIQVEIAGILAGYHPIHLDNLLARMVVDEAYSGHQMDNSGTPYLLPAPLKILWRHPETTLPLYAANQFEPVGFDREVTVWWHKRFVREEHIDARRKMNRGDISASAGRFKEKRIPMPARIATTWQADCIGNRDEIARLLATCRAIGKKRMGYVVEWRIGPVAEFRLNRPAPLAYLSGGSFSLDMRYCGWTPPYWASVPECQGWCVDAAEH